MTPFIFLDLDDTVFHSLRKAPTGKVLKAAAHTRDGRVVSFFSEQQLAFLELMQGHMKVIVTTARNSDALSRVRFCFDGVAIVSYGGLILDESGNQDACWSNRIATQLEAQGDDLPDLFDHLESCARALDPGLRVQIVVDHELALYVVVKHRDADNLSLSRFSHDVVMGSELVRRKYRVHLNDNNLAILPRWLDKAHAVRYLQGIYRQQHADAVFFGMGDSLSDRDYLQLCDYALVPSGSQLHRSVFSKGLSDV